MLSKPGSQRLIKLALIAQVDKRTLPWRSNKSKVASYVDKCTRLTCSNRTQAVLALCGSKKLRSTHLAILVHWSGLGDRFPDSWDCKTRDSFFCNKRVQRFRELSVLLA